ncbi:hypothetical protein ACJMK2_039280 [Sinanodonta woodiana]|uniref:C-type lectin domain-containing protein n=1 Tax=Sinanodonta woodiana TaxID=1069815 RepID=A0ABD3WEW2_SINWO
MQYFPPMAAFVCLISFFEIGHLIENPAQMEVYQIMEELLYLKEDFAEIQKVMANVRRVLNQNVLEIQKLKGNENKTTCHCSRGAAAGQQYELSTPMERKDHYSTRIDFVKVNVAMKDALMQNISYLAIEVENVRKNIDNKIGETNANALTFGNKLEDKVSTIERKFNETMSKQYCQLFGSHLIRIDDHTEFQFIQGVLSELHKTRLKDGAKTLSHYWTAGNDIIKEGDWVWTPLNVPIRYPAWYEMEPNNSNGQEHCAEIDIHRHFKMNDHNCQMDFFPICEIDRKNG